MTQSDFDNQDDERKVKKVGHKKWEKVSMPDEIDNTTTDRRKHSGKRAHRKKKFRDEFLENKNRERRSNE